MAKAKSSNVERTAKAAFLLGGNPVRQGQIVTLNATQLRMLVQAGCVAETDEENELVPVAGLPATQTAPTVHVGDEGEEKPAEHENGA